ncbi:MAG TPA: glycine oxidase ThiO [Pirellulaceae bacterium]|jgi:glycine oxidase
MIDVLIIGGGVIGLSLAWDLAKHGCSVRVIDKGEIGREASWAGAGILPAATYSIDQHPLDQLRGLACELHPQWAAELKSLTGIDTGYWRCGGLHLARSPGEAASLAAWATLAREERIRIQQLSSPNLAAIEPGLIWEGEAPAEPPLSRHSVLSAQYLLPDESQLRNPWHVCALHRACELAGVAITPATEATDFTIANNELIAVQTTSGPVAAHRYCFTSGAWSGQLLQRLDIHVGILPIRGQIVLFRCEKPPIAHIINEGSRYLVPRQDGRLIAGSTEEEVGFDKRTTAEAIADLTQFAIDLVPALKNAAIEKTWAGLRPASFDGLPYLGRLPNTQNAFIASGHFRNGLFLSPATAIVMSQLLRDQPPQIDLTPFRVGR